MITIFLVALVGGLLGVAFYGSSASGTDRRRTRHTSRFRKVLPVQKFFLPEKKAEAKQVRYSPVWESLPLTNLSQTD